VSKNAWVSDCQVERARIAGAATGKDEHRGAEHMVAYIQFEDARVTVIAALAEKHAELRVDVCTACLVRERIDAASGALAQDRHGSEALQPSCCCFS
jgi:hypothetical protein